MSPMKRDPRFIEVELTDEEAPFTCTATPRPMDASERLRSWASVCSGGATNVLTLSGVCYSWDTSPRKLQNGSLQGRVYAQLSGELTRDIGGFKIDARGRVLELPEALRAVLPGA